MANPPLHNERLEWRQLANGVLQALGVRPQRKAKVLYPFAAIRPLINGNGLLQGDGWVVSRNAFDDLREFSTLEEAKIYVESVYELERS